MKVSAVCNWLGPLLITFAVVVHTVCVASSYQVTAVFGYSYSYTSREGTRIEVADIGFFHYGLWNLCFFAYGFDICTELNDEVTHVDYESLIAARVMGILSVLILAVDAIFAVINLAGKSQGDRLRFLPVIIFATSIFGGILSFIGDMIMAGKYGHLVDGKSFMESSLPEAMVLKDISLHGFNLYWCFGLDIVAVFVTFVGGALHMFPRRQSDASGMI